MAGKPLPHIRKPTAAAAASFVEAGAAPTSALELVRPAEAAKASKPKSASEAKGPRRRVSVYLTVGLAKRLRLQSVEQDRDMSDIVEELLAKHLR